jgi:hypothetical protein
MTLTICIMLALALLPAGSRQTPEIKGTPAKIADIAWLAGSWRGSEGTTTIEEHWTTPSGGSMLAVSRTVRDDKLRAYEFLRIAEAGGSLLYLAMPNGRSPATPFTLTKIEARAATFENPAHDFPRMIRYALGDDGVLEATISGAGGEKAQTFRFRKLRGEI